MSKTTIDETIRGILHKTYKHNDTTDLLEGIAAETIRKEIENILCLQAEELWYDGSDIDRKLPQSVQAVPLSKIKELFGVSDE